jgi:hypothetical protein
MFDLFKCMTTARGGQVCDLEFLLSDTTYEHSNILDAAVNGCRLDNVMWLRDHGHPFGDNTFTQASKNGDLTMMQWLKDNECPFGPYTFACAAERGDLSNMQWLLANGCPFGEYTFDYACKIVNSTNMTWLKDNGCPMDDDLYNDYIQKCTAYEQSQ